MARLTGRRGRHTGYSKAAGGVSARAVARAIWIIAIDRKVLSNCRCADSANFAAKTEAASIVPGPTAISAFRKG